MWSQQDILMWVKAQAAQWRARGLLACWWGNGLPRRWWVAGLRGRSATLGLRHGPDSYGRRGAPDGRVARDPIVDLARHEPWHLKSGDDFPRRPWVSCDRARTGVGLVKACLRPGYNRDTDVFMESLILAQD